MDFVNRKESARSRLVRPVLAAMAAAALATATPSAGFAGEHSPEYYRLSERQHRLGDSLLQPEKWREKVAAQKAFLAELDELIRKDPQQHPDIRELASGVRRCIEYDGAAIHWDSKRPAPGELDAALDFVCWVEDDHLRMAAGNPANAPRKTTLSLRQYDNRKKPSEWAAAASIEVEVAAGEVVIVHFDGIPTIGDPRNRDAEWSFAPFAVLTDEAGQKQEVRPIVQGVGGWTGTTAKWVVEAGDVEVAFPQENGVTFANGTRIDTEFTVYVPKQAHCRHRGTSLPVTPLDKAGLIEADHGFFLKNHPARFALKLAVADKYDVVRFPEMVGRIGSGMQMLERQPGPRLLQLGAATPVRRLTVPIAPANRLDAEPLSPDPVKRIDQLFARMRSGLWQVRASSQRQIAAIGAPAVPRLIELLSSVGTEESYSAPAILEQIGEPAIDALAAVSANERSRLMACEVLGKIGGRGVDVLLKRATDPDPKVRRAAVRGENRGQATSFFPVHPLDKRSLTC